MKLRTCWGGMWSDWKVNVEQVLLRITTLLGVNISLSQRYVLLSRWFSELPVWLGYVSFVGGYLSMTICRWTNLNTIFPQNSSIVSYWKHSYQYCWWTKSCTTKDDNYPIIYSVLTIPDGAGFLPSTVSTAYNGDWKKCNDRSARFSR